MSTSLRRWAMAAAGTTLALAPLARSASATSSMLPPLARPAPRATGWRDAGLPAVRGMTIGPIEDALRPGVGYGTDACARALDAAVDLGATWVAFTPFGRMWSTRSSDVDLVFEASFDSNRAAVGRAIAQAHERGLRVMLVPHLWLEAGGWRGEIEPGAPPDMLDDTGKNTVRGRASEASMRAFAESYRRFVLSWADVAQEQRVDLFSLGVELRSWATSGRATDALRATIADVRRHYDGLLTYSANWDDVDDLVLIADLDVIGVNAFYPLAERAGATRQELVDGGARVASRVRTLAESWNKPVVFTEVGYTTRADPALRPWEWPDGMKDVRIDEEAQADAYRGVLSSVIGEPSFAGFFVWRAFSDPDDVSQEPAWGFPVAGKLAELVLRDAYATRWGVDGWTPLWTMFGRGSRGIPGASWQFPLLALPELARSLARSYPAAP